MSNYIIRRLLLIVPTIIIVTLIMTIAIRFVPGDIIDVKISVMDFISKEALQQERARIAEELGLDVPIYIYYARWMGNLILHGDMGDSLWQGTPVLDEITARLPVTLELGVFAVIIALAISFPVGIYSAVRQDTPGDYLARTFAILCISIPSFWAGTMVVVFPSIWWGWSPPVINIPFLEDPAGNLKMYLLPAIVLGMVMNGVNMRMTRTMMLEVLRQDYIRTAWSKGLKEKVVVMRHALKNALIPVITIIGLQMPIVIGGSVIIEQIFGLPGMGRLMVTAAYQRDYTMMVGVTFVLSIVVLLCVLITDLSYAYLDPRIRYK